MGENIGFRPAFKIKQGSGGEKIETVGGQFGAIFARQPNFQFIAQLVQIKHVRGRIFHLLRGQFVSAPVGTLLLFGNLNAGQLAAQILEAMILRIGAGQFGGDFGAIDRCGHDAEVMIERGDIKARKMKDLGDFVISQQRL